MERLLKQQQALLSLVDSWFAKSMRRYPDKIACRDGCSGCCRALFDITLLDAYYLRFGFESLPAEVKDAVRQKCLSRLASLREKWPEFDHPYLLNYRPEEEWQLLMPEEDETPCVLLGDDGRCLVYQHRPMTCRLHGLPLIDTDGGVMDDEWCTLNFTDEDPLALPGLAAPFDEIFREEVALFRAFTEKLLGKEISELDTFIPTALLIDFDKIEWP